MNIVLWFSLFIRMVHNAASIHVCAQTICHFRLLPNAFIVELCNVFFSSLFFFFLEEAAWSCQGLRGDNNLGWRMTPWEWQMKRNQILPGANCMELIQAPPPHFSPHKQASALTYSNRRSSLSLDTRPVPKSRAGRGNRVRKSWGKKIE